jgi:hypothetical protein
MSPNHWDEGRQGALRSTNVNNFQIQKGMILFFKLKKKIIKKERKFQFQHFSENRGGFIISYFLLPKASFAVLQGSLSVGKICL